MFGLHNENAELRNEEVIDLRRSAAAGDDDVVKRVIVLLREKQAMPESIEKLADETLQVALHGKDQ